MADTRPDRWPPMRPQRAGWTGGRIASVVVGVLLGLISLGALAAGGAALWADQTQRADGYVNITTGNLHTDGYALTSGVVNINAGGQWVADAVIGRIRVVATPAGAMKPLFVGIAPAASAAAYLRGSHYASIPDIFPSRPGYRVHAGTARPAAPATAGFWVAQSSGGGAQTVRWPARVGRWTVVVMNADASAGVSASVVGGMSAPALTSIAAGLLAGGAVLLMASVVMVVIPVRRAGRLPEPPPGGTGGWGPPASRQW